MYVCLCACMYECMYINVLFSMWSSHVTCAII